MRTRQAHTVGPLLLLLLLLLLLMSL